MDTKIFIAKNKYNLESTITKLNEYDFYDIEDSQIAIFHCNLIEENLYHIVFHIDDEYIVGTTLTGTFNTEKIDKYVNAFLFVDKSFIFIENLHHRYNEIIMKFIVDFFDIEFINYNITKKDFSNIINETFVKKIIDYTIKDCEYLEELNENPSLLEAIKDNNIEIESVMFTPNIENFYTELISIKIDGVFNATIKKLSTFIVILKWVVSIIEKN